MSNDMQGYVLIVFFLMMGIPAIIAAWRGKHDH